MNAIKLLYLCFRSFKIKGGVCDISDDHLAQIEGIQCNDSNLMVLDYHSGKSFTLFELDSGRMIGRFGSIGQGAGEIPLGAYGYLEKSYIYIPYQPTEYIGKYDIEHRFLFFLIC